MISNSLITAASFTPNSLQPPNAWVGHLPFASWIIQEVAPKIFVELGTHTGNSYFSFCQAVVEAGLTTKCYAVDTWQGDEHAGQYGDEIFAKVSAHHQERYAGFSRLLRMTFDDAVSYFADESMACKKTLCIKSCLAATSCSGDCLAICVIDKVPASKDTLQVGLCGSSINFYITLSI